MAKQRLKIGIIGLQRHAMVVVELAEPEMKIEIKVTAFKQS